jgi:hypothetical protein
MMAYEQVEISIKGRRVHVPSIRVGTYTVIVSPGWLTKATVKDEAWLPGEAVTDPGAWIERLMQAHPRADLFTFTQKLPHTRPRYAYPIEWESVAAIPTGDFDAWWQRLPQATRKNVRRAQRRGVIVRKCVFDDELLRQIVEINNETPVRQGRRFWHYGKSLAQVRADYVPLNERSTYIGAYHESELIGFIKMVDLGETASILQLLCKQAHSDKRPANTLLASAVEICSTRGVAYLTYGRYDYGTSDSSLTEFKRRGGFEEMLLPRYYVPLTAKARLALALKIHRGRRMLPTPLMSLARRARSAWYERTLCRESTEAVG